MSTISDSVTRRPGPKAVGRARVATMFSNSAMNRFNKSFNGVDRSTSRPFSHGHPDGVWVLSIVYGLIVVMTGALVAVKIWQAPRGQVSLGMTIPFFVAIAMFVPPIILLFQRKTAAVIWVMVLTAIWMGADVLAILSLQKAHELQLPTIIGLILGLLLQVYPAFYTVGLKRDSLLS